MEHLLPGKLGFLMILIALVAAIAGALANYMAQKNESNLILYASWRKLGRSLFILHFLCTIGVFSTLFYIIYNHYFEYQYAWQHSSLSLPTHYMISCFWEGQEGSFLLWIFWHGVLGSVVLRQGGKWEPSVMMVLLGIQAFLCSMILGVDIAGVHLGSSPFLLLKDFMLDAPVFQQPNYMDFVKDGNGLNPLLQNYWMVIHPPTLFLGFASTAIPFAFAIAGLLRSDYKGWIAPVLPWVLFSGGILGTGILMGGAWAYEALTFGGFWAWDPVENASLVPWITLVAGLHTLLAYRSSGYSLRATFLLLLLTFLLILYSTFLTRSGILGDSSVHSFTDLGMSGQLLMYLLFFVFLSIGLLAYHWKKIPHIAKEEASYSREFWLFVGALLLCVSSFQITFDTSREVINKVLGTSLAKPVDAIDHYNRWQIWIAVIVALLSASIQYLKYKNSDSKKFYISLIAPLAVSLVLTLFLVWFWSIAQPQNMLLLAAAMFSLIANASYIITALKGNIAKAGSSIAHIGFALILVGILVSAGTKEVISDNTAFSIEDRGADKNNAGENVILFKNNKVAMAGYELEYIGDSVAAPNTFFKVRMQKIDTSSKSMIEQFILTPNAQVNPRMGLIASPDTRHYWTKDIYTHVTSVPDRTDDASNLAEKLDTIMLGVGDTTPSKWGMIVLQEINPNPENPSYQPLKGDIAFGAKVLVVSKDMKKELTCEPIYYIRNNSPQYIVGSINEVGLNFTVIQVLPDKKKIVIAIRKVAPDYITLKAIVFPYINLLWLGSVVMVAGFLLSLLHRRRGLLRMG